MGNIFEQQKLIGNAVKNAFDVQKRIDDSKRKKIVLDYSSMIEDFSAGAFRLCVEQLYPITDYMVMTEGDIRKIDLKEWMSHFDRYAFSMTMPIEMKEQNDYLYLLRLYLKSSVSCEKNSRAGQYLVRALSLLNSAVDSANPMEDLDDAVVILIALLRESLKNANGRKKRNIADISLELTEKDMSVVQQILLSKGLGPEEVSNRLVMSGTVKAESMPHLQGYSESVLSMARINMYVDTVFFLCRILDMRGAFGEDGGDEFNE